jgi:hypothetical protein
VIEHLDETGRPCTRHTAVAVDKLMSYAAIGSRVSGFHHDAASKLQSLMMALDELAEVMPGTDADAPIETAQIALRELHKLFTTNRALTKVPQRRPTPLRELMSAASDRAGVRVTGEVPEYAVSIALPSMIHAVALTLDVAAGALQHGRSVTLSATAGPNHAVVEIVGAAEAEPQAGANELVAIAAFLLAREEGTLRCSPRGFVLEIPLGS